MADKSLPRRRLGNGKQLIQNGLDLLALCGRLKRPIDQTPHAGEHPIGMGRPANCYQTYGPTRRRHCP
eukprot:10408980-Lingulodinium_polyedra.AAC.1